MTAADRRRIVYEMHRRHLLNVTGLVFGPAYMDPLARGVGFRHILRPTKESQHLPVEIVSLLREPDDVKL